MPGSGETIEKVQVWYSVCRGQSRFRFEDILTQNPKCRVIETLKGGQQQSMVLSRAGRRTGKEMFAMPSQCQQRDKGKLSLECAALPRSWWARDFGYCGGSVYGAKRGGNPGKI
jgi:transcriptional regulator with PAS, ATPase and Fis domain